MKTNEAESPVTDTHAQQSNASERGSRRAYLLTAAISAVAAAVVATTIPVLAQSSPAQSSAPASQQPANATLASPPPGAPLSFADLTARLQPAVVNISTTQRVEVGRRFPFPRLGPDSNLGDLFRRFQEQQGDDGQPVTREANSLGSGFILSADGYIVTNNHVISGRDGQKLVDTITVTLSDRREFTAKVVGRDQLSDLALLKVDGKDLPHVQFGNSEGTRVGDWAIAIGNPFGLGGTVTAGIVSALHRGIQGGGAYDRYIQTDASINQGNSGGPLFDLNGNVIGVNTAIFSPTGGNVGLGFAIPSELAQPVIEQLKDNGQVRRGYLGVQIQAMSPAIADSLGLPKDRGEIVASVEPSGPARTAGIQQGDVIVRVAGQDVTPDNNLSFIIANTRIGSRVPIELIRNGRRQTVTATLSERPAESVLLGQADDSEEDDSKSAADASDAARKSLGLTLQPLTADIRRQLRLADDAKGVVIADVNPSSDAAEQGLQRGDILSSINQTPVESPQQAADAVSAARKSGRDTVLLFVQRGNTPGRFVGVKVQ